jgi:hypothetical protein
MQEDQVGVGTVHAVVSTVAAKGFQAQREFSE